MTFPPFTFLYLADAFVLVFFVLSGYVLTRRFFVTTIQQSFSRPAVRVMRSSFLLVL